MKWLNRSVTIVNSMLYLLNIYRYRFLCFLDILKLNGTTAHHWCSGRSTSISTCGVWGVRVGVQASMREFYIYIDLDYARVEFLSCKKKKKNSIALSVSMFLGYLKTQWNYLHISRFILISLSYCICEFNLIVFVRNFVCTLCHELIRSCSF